MTATRTKFATKGAVATTVATTVALPTAPRAVRSPRASAAATRRAAVAADTVANEESILVLQGGGALGAYQGGVYESMGAVHHALSWVAGISIGAINAALIVGNPPEKRVARLREFWDLVSSSLATSMASTHGKDREAFNESSASQVMLFGVPGFFKPRFPPAPFQPYGTAGAISYYDTAPLADTLNRLVDFDRINAGSVRLSVGAVNVRTGNFEYFDSTKQRIDARHIMASGALPPGFAPVEIDGEHYWDGGLVSNTPLHHVLDQPGKHRRVVFQVDLFAARGALPATLGEVVEREKDIRFSSRTRMSTTTELDRQAIAQAAQRLILKLPAALRDDPDVHALARVRCEHAVDVVHLIYRSKHYESQSKDYEFSRLSMREHWDAGRADMAHTLHDKRWLNRPRNDHGVHVYDLNSDASVGA